MTDPFEQLAAPFEPRAPRTPFVRALRARLVDALELDPIDLDLLATIPVIDLTERNPMSTTSSTASFSAAPGTGAGRPYVDGIWSAVAYADPDAGIAFVTDTLGFEEQVLVRDPDGRIIHSEYRWPEGGVVQVVAADPDNPFAPEPGQKGGLYVITHDPHAVWERCRRADIEVLRPPEEPHYDPGGMGFAIRDLEGNIWSFGSYAGGSPV